MDIRIVSISANEVTIASGGEEQQFHVTVNIPGLGDQIIATDACFYARIKSLITYVTQKQVQSNILGGSAFEVEKAVEQDHKESTVQEAEEGEIIWAQQPDGSDQLNRDNPIGVLADGDQLSADDAVDTLAQWQGPG